MGRITRRRSRKQYPSITFIAAYFYISASFTWYTWYYISQQNMGGLAWSQVGSRILEAASAQKEKGN